MVSFPYSMTANGWQLPEGGDFEVLHFQPSRKFDRSTKLDLTTEPHFWVCAVSCNLHIFYYFKSVI